MSGSEPEQKSTGRIKQNGTQRPPFIVVGVVVPGVYGVRGCTELFRVV